MAKPPECMNLFGSLYPDPCTPAETETETPVPQQITPEQAFGFLEQGLSLFFQTLTGIMKIKAIDEQGNFIAENGQTVPGNTPVIVAPPEEEKPAISMEMILLVGVVGLIAVMALRRGGA